MKKKNILIILAIACICVLTIILCKVGVETYKNNHSNFASNKGCCTCYDCPSCDVCCSCDNIFNQIIKGLKYHINENKSLISPFL